MDLIVDGLSLSRYMIAQEHNDGSWDGVYHFMVVDSERRATT